MQCQEGYRWQKEMKKAHKCIWSLENIKLWECDLCVCMYARNCYMTYDVVKSVVYKVLCSSKHLLAK